MNQSNPFAGMHHCERLSFTLSKEHVPLFHESLSDLALAVSAFETEEDETIWMVQVLCEEEEAGELEDRLARLAEISGIAVPALQRETVESKDWVSETQKNFPPQRIGRFFIHGSHYLQNPSPRLRREDRRGADIVSASPHPDPSPRAGEGIYAFPPASIPLLIDAGMAFGSGEHETTSGCLLAIEKLAGGRRFSSMLDMGCGSGILAMAMAKVFRRPVMASDIDPVAVTVAQENIRRNHLHPWVQAVCGPGYASPVIARHGPYDLIVANILARPLMRMAPALRKHLAPGGCVVLSGLLDRQEAMVLEAHRQQGLRLKERIRRNGWHTLILQG